MFTRNKNRDKNRDDDDLADEERFEDLLLDWIRTVTIFFIAGLALYHFTIDGKPYAIIAFFLTIIMVATMIIDYILRRNELTSKGIHPRLVLDVMVAVMMVGLALIVWVTYDVIVLPYDTSMTGGATKTELID